MWVSSCRVQSLSSIFHYIWWIASRKLVSSADYMLSEDFPFYQMSLEIFSQYLLSCAIFPCTTSLRKCIYFANLLLKANFFKCNWTHLLYKQTKLNAYMFPNKLHWENFVDKCEDLNPLKLIKISVWKQITKRTRWSKLMISC